MISPRNLELKARITRTGLTYAELAAMLGTKPQRIARIIAGWAEAKPEEMAAINRALLAQDPQVGGKPC